MRLQWVRAANSYSHRIGETRKWHARALWDFLNLKTHDEQFLRVRFSVFFFSESRFMRFIRFGVESFHLVVVAYFPKIILRNRFRTIRVAFHWSIDLYHFIRVALKLTVLCSDKDHVLVFRVKVDEWKYRKMKNLHQFTDGREKEKDNTNSWLIVVAK